MIKVLVADDERIIRKTIISIGEWEKNGMEVVGEAANGCEVLEKTGELKPDIVFLDMKMPGLSGQAVMTELQKLEKKPLIIIISGFDDYDYMHAAIKYGAADYILKPIDRNVFNELLKNIADNFRKDGLSIQDKDIIQVIKKKIDQYFYKELTLSSLAEEFFLTKNVLSRKFKARYKIGITAYINKQRLEQSKVYLMFGYTITETAEKVGYRDVNYFSRLFKKEYSITPGEYRAMVRNGMAD